MKSNTMNTSLINIATALTLLAATSAALAAANPEKHPCPVGQTWVVENGIGKCKPLTIKANTGAQDSSVQPSRATTDAVRAPASPKPDYTIVAAKPMGAPGNYRVTVKNLGGAHYAEMVLWGTHQKKGGQSWGAAANIKTVFGAGEQKYIDVTFAPGDFARGDRVMFEVDYYKAVAETNETNNKYATNF